MNVTTAYEVTNLDDHLSKNIFLAERPTIVLRELSKTKFAIRRLTSDNGLAKPVGGLPPEKSFLISVHLRCPDDRGWKTSQGDDSMPREIWSVGGVGIYDLEIEPAFFGNGVLDCVNYFLPRTTLDAFTDEVGWPRVAALQCPRGTRDHVLHHLAEIILPMLGEPEMICQPYLEHYLSMLCAYLVRTYGTIRVPNEQAQGGLSPWQRRRVIESIRNDLKGQSSVATHAESCGLSPSHFARCFRKSFGVPVHRYIIHQRIEVAKALLLDQAISLSEISLRTGFADQAAFGRTFGALVGATPAKWRKQSLCSQDVHPTGKGETAH